jgi:hypothetical protein
MDLQMIPEDIAGRSLVATFPRVKRMAAHSLYRFFGLVICV